MVWTGHEGEYLDEDQVWRRAGGRRRYNAVRRFRAALRRIQVYELWRRDMGPSAIARQLGVHHSTISRDIEAIYKALSDVERCPLCGSVRDTHSFSRALSRVPPRAHWQQRLQRQWSTISLSEVVVRQLAVAAAQRGVSVSTIVREAITAYLQADGNPGAGGEEES
jgi:hypothetical protein